MKTIFKIIVVFVVLFIIPIMVYGGIPIYLGITAGKPLLGAIVAILGLTGIYGFLLSGFFGGALYVLIKPPSIGESYIEIRYKNRILYKSPKEIFDPPKNAPAPVIIDLSIFPYPFLELFIPRKPPYGLPTKRYEDWVKWKKTYSIIEPMKTNGISWDDIKAFLENNHSDLPSSLDTLSNINKAGKAGLLDKWTPDWRRVKSSK